MDTTSPLSLSPEGKDVQTQYGALCWREEKGELQVLLITSRDTGRWVIPKGWHIPELEPPASAAQEAFEEAGVRGEVGSKAVGRFTYLKGPGRTATRESGAACVVTVFPLRVERLVSRFPEAGQRKRKWFAPDKAARRVAEFELRALLLAFAPPQDGPRGRSGTKRTDLDFGEDRLRCEIIIP